MSKRTEMVKKLYLEGIRDGKPREALNACIGARYTQHSTGVPDGPEGFLEFFIPFLERNPKREIEIVRVFEDGYHVFVHAYQSLNEGAARWVTMDLFDTDDHGTIIEHWDTIVPYQDASTTGRGQVEGPTEIVDLQATERNKQVVRRLVHEGWVGGDASVAASLIGRDHFVQHDPARPHDGTAKYEYVFKVVGAGNFVASYSRAHIEGKTCAVFDLFRLEGGKIVEHWSNPEEIAPREEWGNVGKF